VDLAEHFFGTFLPRYQLPVDDLSRFHLDRPNHSLQSLTVEVIRALNAYGIRDGIQPPNSALRNWFMANTGRFDLGSLHAAIKANAATLPFSDASADARRLHEMLCTTFADRLVKPSQAGCLFTPRDVQFLYFPKRYLTDRPAREVLDEIYATYRREFHSEA
jgi:hypothetical protein